MSTHIHIRSGDQPFQYCTHFIGKTKRKHLFNKSFMLKLIMALQSVLLEVFCLKSAPDCPRIVALVDTVTISSLPILWFLMKQGTPGKLRGTLQGPKR